MFMVTLTQLSLYSAIWDESFGLIIGSGAPNGVKFYITNPDKITKIGKSSSIRQAFQSIRTHFISLVIF